MNATVFTAPYRENAQRQTLWAATRKRLKRTDGSERFADAMTFVLKFIEPPFRAATRGRDLYGHLGRD